MAALQTPLSGSAVLVFTYLAVRGNDKNDRGVGGVSDIFPANPRGIIPYEIQVTGEEEKTMGTNISI